MDHLNSYNHFDHNVGPSHSLPVSQPYQTNTSKARKGLRIIWTAEMTEALLETLKVQMDLGRRSDSVWKPEAWKIAQEAVIRVSRERANPTVAQVKSKLDNLKLLYKKWIDLSKQFGFGWNEETELYEAADDVWDNYLKAHKYAKWHRNNPLPNRDILHSLFADSQGNVDGAVSMVPSTNDSGVNIDSVRHNGLLNSQPQPKSLKRKSGRSDGHDDEQASAKPKETISTDKEYSLMLELLANRRKTQVHPSRSKQEMAVVLLYSDYEARLDIDSFVEAINLIENESKATIFTSMRPGDKRDRWLELQIGTVLEPLDID